MSSVLPWKFYSLIFYIEVYHLFWVHFIEGMKYVSGLPFYFILLYFSYGYSIDPAAPCVKKKKKSTLFHWIDSHIVKNQLTTFSRFISGLFILTIVSISNLLLWSLYVYSSLQASKVAEMVKNVCVYRFFASFLYRQSCHVGITMALWFFPFQSVCLVFLCCCMVSTYNSTGTYTTHTYKYVLALK